MLYVTDSVQIDETYLEERFVRASGPGGQNVNKVSTAVELRFNVAGAPLPYDVKQRLRAAAGSKMTTDDVLVIDSREHRLQSQNRGAARERLASLIRHALVAPKSRRATKPKAGARERRLTTKKLRGHIKAGRTRQSFDED